MYGSVDGWSGGSTRGPTHEPRNRDSVFLWCGVVRGYFAIQIYPSGFQVPTLRHEYMVLLKEVLVFPFLSFSFVRK